MCAHDAAQSPGDTAAGKSGTGGRSPQQLAVTQNGPMPGAGSGSDPGAAPAPVRRLSSRRLR